MKYNNLIGVTNIKHTVFLCTKSSESVGTTGESITINWIIRTFTMRKINNSIVGNTIRNENTHIRKSITVVVRTEDIICVSDWKAIATYPKFINRIVPLAVIRPSGSVALEIVTAHE